ncbi:hypothetical protein HIM_06896 [Hirsutella minnesotensis 3608]|uniref:Uncharacterized protein n=1 Tax=Hirsutella minnesotensis 3608 TaxID=1043627 RepID=A0A0F7ZTV6_9HYPO|nr:hypothetical protein HIM_06896 [Hirsutella minnesotensis 3608]
MPSRYSRYDTDEERLPDGMTRAGHHDGHHDDDDLGAPFLKTPQPAVSWRHDLNPLLNFGMLIGLCLLGLFWYLHWAAAGLPLQR